MKTCLVPLSALAESVRSVVVPRVKALSAAACALAASASLAEMEPASPESQGMDSQAILDWIDACERTFDGAKEGRIHGFVIVRHGKTVAEGSWKPFDTLNEPHMLYSHSKSFTSSAVGFLVDEGKLDLDERIVDIFPESLPENPSDNLRQLRVRDLLTMNVGKKDHLLRGGDDWVKEFLSKDFSRKPGTGFRYDSDATYMLAAIVERRTGKKLMDFLKERMFDKIGITSAWSTTSPQGIACGGWGMNMTTRDIARFGQLYLQNGKWGDSYVLTPFWTALATARHTWSGWQNIGVRALGEGSDWEQGYGFQFWRCSHGAYRADGAAGQYTVVVPEKDMVVSVHAGLHNMGSELALIWKHLLPGAKEEPLPEGEAFERLGKRLAGLAIPPTAGGAAGLENFLGKTYEFRKNHRGIASVRFEKDGDGLFCVLKVPAGEQRIPVGVGEWKKGEMRFDVQDYEFLGAYIGVHRTAASAGSDGNGGFKARIYLTGDTGFIDVAVSSDGRASGYFFAMNGTKLEAAPAQAAQGAEPAGAESPRAM